ncbi:Lrp/AsnC family transcriptional regulator [Chitinophaga tropicalis]|uniref:Winged helix-turn-helix transcriptional regulator n=1 Tax=Chitinophaga tropicalis TaxID=2683588 RepID=A0A7K1TX23_9BACT|nr:Lrp/AsnC family transcriptional regulator [Chitinophaga tropicalis]MVT06636.1 winged helix-turn-helix transcriptional regulator [Chitinophaga tropicalis]
MNFTLDETDLHILDLLQEDARLTNKEIASRLGKSMTAIFERIKRLEAEGYIKGYIAIVDRHKMDKHVIVFVNVTLKEQSHEACKLFEEKVNAFPEVMECYMVNGQSDFLLKVMIADIDEYELFLSNKLSKLECVSKLCSLFVISETKHENALSLSPGHFVRTFKHGKKD